MSRSIGMPVSSTVVRLANKASSPIILDAISSYIEELKQNKKLNNFNVKVAHANELVENERRKIWALVETNMRHQYTASSFGWNPPEKKKELFNSKSRFLLAQTDGPDDALAGFTMFRFEYEDNENILYCYELQVSTSVQRTGLGRKLVFLLEKIGTRWDMIKIVLTVFKNNMPAIEFYKANGFDIDVSSPSNFIEHDPSLAEVDYEILSKSLE